MALIFLFQIIITERLMNEHRKGKTVQLSNNTITYYVASVNLMKKMGVDSLKCRGREN